MTRRVATILSFITLLLVGVVPALGGCATVLEPAPEAQRVTGIGRAAAAEDAGVRVVASAGAWRGYPENVEEEVTPLLVTITNESERRIELRYEHFSLVTPGGTVFAALPPFGLTGVAFEPVYPMYSVYPAPGFGVAPYLSPWYPGWSVWAGPFPYRSVYYDAYYPAFVRVVLPSGDMVQKALPEGVMTPGGRITGFLYFEAVEDVRHISFTMRLVDADSGERVGTIEIPFVATKGSSHW